MKSWTLEEKIAIKELEKVIKGNEAKILAIYQATPYIRLSYSPEELQKLLNSLPEDAPLPEGRIGVEIHDKEKGRIVLRLPKLDFVIRPDTARRLTADLLKVMRENNIIQSLQVQALPCRTCGNLDWGECGWSSIPTDLKKEDGSCGVWVPITPEEEVKNQHDDHKL